jgi:hypothetical protein
MCCETLGSCYLLRRRGQIHPDVEDVSLDLFYFSRISEVLGIDLSWICSNIDGCEMLVRPNSTLGKETK